MALVLMCRHVAAGDWRSALAEATDQLDDALAPRAFKTHKDPPGLRANSMWLGSDQALRQLGFRRGAETSLDQLATALQTAGGAVDLTFSAPQSVSWLWASAGSEQSAGLENAMVVAVSQALGRLTQTEHFAASVILHATVRVFPNEPTPPPLLHIHCYVLGVLDGDTALRPLDTAPLDDPDTMRMLGALGRAALAHELKMLGYGIEALTGPDQRYFEVKGVPKGMFHPRLWHYAQCGGFLGDDFLREWNGPGY
jgi:hypothetical protein